MMETERKSIHTRGMPAFMLILLLFLLTGCLGGGGNSETTTDASLVTGVTGLRAGTAKLRCTPECANMGGCGDSQERGKVVLLSTFFPATEMHNLNYAIPTETEVTISQGQGVEMRRMMNDERFFLNYYLVAIPGLVEPGWVAGYCIAGTPAQ